MILDLDCLFLNSRASAYKPCCPWVSSAHLCGLICSYNALFIGLLKVLNKIIHSKYLSGYLWHKTRYVNIFVWLGGRCPRRWWFQLDGWKEAAMWKAISHEGMAYVETLHGEKCNVWNNGRKAQRTKLSKKVDSNMKWKWNNN